jgi:hypothetical protein
MAWKLYAWLIAAALLLPLPWKLFEFSTGRDDSPRRVKVEEMANAALMIAGLPALFAMTDPFWMLMVLHALGDGYIVWDKAATIDFEKPGRGPVHAEFALDDATLEELRAAAAGGDKVLRWFDAPVRDAAGDVVAMVRKQLYVRRKRPKD